MKAYRRSPYPSKYPLPSSDKKDDSSTSFDSALPTFFKPPKNAVAYEPASFKSSLKKDISSEPSSDTMTKGRTDRSIQPFVGYDSDDDLKKGLSGPDEFFSSWDRPGFEGGKTDGGGNKGSDDDLKKDRFDFLWAEERDGGKTADRDKGDHSLRKGLPGPDGFLSLHGGKSAPDDKAGGGLRRRLSDRLGFRLPNKRDRGKTDRDKGKLTPPPSFSVSSLAEVMWPNQYIYTQPISFSM